MFGLVAVARFGRVVVLRVDQAVQDIDRVVLIRAYAAIKNFLLACHAVEIPGAAAVLDDRNGKRPVLRADIESHRLIWLNNHAMHLIVAADKVGSPVLIRNVVATAENVVGPRPENAG